MYVSIEKDATTTEQSEMVSVKSIILLINDGSTNKLRVNFYGSTNDLNCMTLMPGEKLVNLPIRFTNLNFIGIDGSTPFRFWGLKG